MPDVSQHATVILAHQTRVVGSPRRQVSRVESGCDDVIQVGEKQPPIVRQRDDSTHIVAADERRVYRAGPGKVHVPQKRQGFAILGPEVNDEVVLKAQAVSVHIAGECLHRECPHPFVHVHELLRSRVQCRPGQTERLRQIDERQVIVMVTVVFNEKIPAIGFLAVAAVTDVRADDLVRLGQFQTLHVAVNGTLRTINQFQLEFFSVAAVEILGVQELVAVLGHQQKAGAGVLIERRNETDQVVIHARQAAGVVDGVLQNNFVLVASFVGVAARAVDGDRIVHAAERLVGMKLDGETDA